MPNYFTEGSTYENNSRIMEFALDYHILVMNSDLCIEKYNKDISEVLEDLKYAFNDDQSQSTKSSVIKSLVLICLFDNFDKNKLLEFLESLESDSYFIDRIVENAKTLCEKL
jgi:hypothetical protein